MGSVAWVLPSGVDPEEVKHVNGNLANFYHKWRLLISPLKFN